MGAMVTRQDQELRDFVKQSLKAAAKVPTSELARTAGVSDEAVAKLFRARETDMPTLDRLRLWIEAGHIDPVLAVKAFAEAIAPGKVDVKPVQVDPLQAAAVEATEALVAHAAVREAEILGLADLAERRRKADEEELEARLAADAERKQKREAMDRMAQSMKVAR